VREAVRPSSTVINDVRIRGGGISLDSEELSIDVQPEAVWYWDLKFWDGYPYPGAASFFVDVPVDILENCGGRFTPKQVQEITHRHIAAGVYPVVWKYNVYEPVITDIEYLDEGAVISWSQGPDDAIYQIYCSSVEEGPYTAISEIFTNNPAGNSTQVDLDAGLIKYLVVVGRKDTDGPICFSGPINIEDAGDIPEFDIVNATNQLGHEAELLFVGSGLMSHEFSATILPDFEETFESGWDMITEGTPVWGTPDVTEDFSDW
jgi:hypothetical protein